MFSIPTEAVSQFCRSLATSQVAQAAAGTILGLAIWTTGSALLDAVSQPVTRAWQTFRQPAPPILNATAQPAV
jgi:hypothetical protein